MQAVDRSWPLTEQTLAETEGLWEVQRCPCQALPWEGLASGTARRERAEVAPAPSKPGFTCDGRRGPHLLMTTHEDTP